MLTSALVVGQTDLLTVAEKTDYESTSRYSDVMAFVSKLISSSSYIRVETPARTIEGRDIPHPGVIGLLRTHGIIMEKLEQNTRIVVERFNITELRGESHLNQGHYTNTIKGNFVQDTIEFQTGTVVVRTAQPVANVAAYLLESQSNDGLMTWNFLDRYLVPQWGLGYNPYPVYRVMNKVYLKTIAFEK